MIAVKINDLTKKYKDTVAVNGLSLEISEGEIFSLLGTNGAGKTTTIKMLSCLTDPTSGDAEIFGKSIKNDIIDVKRLIAVSPQETAVAPGLSVRENLELMCGIYRFDRKKSENKIREMTEIFSLSKIENKKAGKLSGGWQRRLSIAMALISEPRLLFLDEPTLGLDVIARRELHDTIRRLAGHTTIILTTHYLDEAEALSDRIGIMCAGKLLICDTAENIKGKTGTNSFEEAFIRMVSEAEK
ncbi:MAG: ABC transporter ATP-binding protein [Ruminococcaceae bacterium]|nr:ABC transporter ATP-binding protein [Oscillospiraceae bacterium]